MILLIDIDIYKQSKLVQATAASLHLYKLSKTPL